MHVVRPREEKTTNERTKDMILLLDRKVRMDAIVSHILGPVPYVYFQNVTSARAYAKTNRRVTSFICGDAPGSAEWAAELRDQRENVVTLADKEMEGVPNFDRDTIVGNVASFIKLLRKFEAKEAA